MGCDIHMWVEQFVGDRWTFDHPYQRTSEFDMDHVEFQQPYEGRDYLLFSFLANVRNAPPRITPISLPRGVPLDVSEVGAEIVAEWGAGAHSHSWLSVEEILTYDFSQHLPLNGLIRMEDAQNLALSGLRPAKRSSTKFRGYLQKASWSSPLRDMFAEFIDKTILPLAQKSGGPRRICFFFDN